MVEAEISKIKGVKVHAQSTKVELTAKEKAKFKKLVDEMF